jgi:16S rRNA (cytosine1402-N4)-methyltransferase
MYHTPVLLKESIQGLQVKAGGTYVDATFGGGGHSRAILDRLSSGRLFAFDRDPSSQSNAPEDNHFTLVINNFRHIKNYLKLYNVENIDGLLADLGVSSHQFDSAERGFSTRLKGSLDMRMNPNAQRTALEIVNTYPEEELTRILVEFGEVTQAKKLSYLICEKRSLKSIETTEDLVHITTEFAPRGKENKYLAQVFQAIRIEVNEELDSLKELLEQAGDLIVKGGRLVIISYHSLEDRLVKNFIKSGNFEGKIEKDFYGNPLTNFKSISRKPIVPSEEEIMMNSRARSAKLRVAERI